MTKIIAHRRELFALEESTFGFSEIGKCTNLADYWKLIKSSFKIYDAAGTCGSYTKDEWQGLVIGEPFLNFWFWNRR